MVCPYRPCSTVISREPLREVSHCQLHRTADRCAMTTRISAAALRMLWQPEESRSSNLYSHHNN